MCKSVFVTAVGLGVALAIVWKGGTVAMRPHEAVGERPLPTSICRIIQERDEELLAARGRVADAARGLLDALTYYTEDIERYNEENAEYTELFVMQSTEQNFLREPTDVPFPQHAARIAQMADQFIGMLRRYETEVGMIRRRCERTLTEITGQANVGSAREPCNEQDEEAIEQAQWTTEHLDELWRKITAHYGQAPRTAQEHILATQSAR